MATPMVKTGCWGPMSDTEMNSSAKISLAALAASPSFSSIATQVADATLLYNTFSDALTLSKTRSLEAVAKKNQARQAINSSMEKLAFSVNALALGDLSVLYGSAMPMAKGRGSTPPVDLQKPQGIVAVNCQNSGDVKVSVGEAIGAVSFVYQYTLDPITEKSIWESQGSKRKSFIFTGLTPGTKVWFRVIAVGSYEQQMISDTIPCIVI